MADFEEEIQKYREQKEQERKAFFDKVGAVEISDEQKYDLMALFVCQRYGINASSFGGVPNIVYGLVNEYVDENIQTNFFDWLHSNDAPLLRKAEEIKKIFPEIAMITDSDREIVKIANSIYGLDLEYVDGGYKGDYLYSFKFSFEDFTPINILEVKELVYERKICEKYDVDCSQLNEKLSEYGLTDEQLNSLLKCGGK